MTGDWLRHIDFSTLERVSGNHVGDDLRARASDIVWRVRCGAHYIYLLIEFQSRIERFMPLRVLTYVGLLYQDLLRLIRLENCREAQRLNELMSTLVEALKGPEQTSLRRAFAVWLSRVIFARLPGGRSSNDQWEKRTMLEERVLEWEQQFLREGEARLLARLLQKRFGDLPGPVRARLDEAPPDQLELWGERLLEVANLNELFIEQAPVRPLSPES
ncbi:MAG: Rpn family recombination-promoting nuclease/putative transposase [Gammaproteobacteria bacterium]